MKTLRNLVLLLLGIGLALFLIITICHVSMTTAYGSCTQGMCVDKMRTNYWGVAAYAGLGLAFIAAALLSLVMVMWRLRLALKNRAKK